MSALLLNKHWLFFCRSCFTSCRLLQPIFLGWLVSYFSEESRDDESSGYIYGALVILCSIVSVWTVHPYMLSILHLGMKIRVATCSLAYRKVSSFLSCLIFLKKLEQVFKRPICSCILASTTQPSSSEGNYSRTTCQPFVKWCKSVWHSSPFYPLSLAGSSPDFHHYWLLNLWNWLMACHCWSSFIAHLCTSSR